MKRWLLILVVAVYWFGADRACAQWVNPYVTQWHVYSDMGLWNGPVQYGAGGYYYYPYNGQTAYSNAVRAEAELTMARAEAAEQYAKAAEYNERARQQYLENKARYDEIRRQQRAAIEARKQKEREEQRIRASRRPPPKKPTELNPRLSPDQLDPLSGEIHWPDSLMSSAYEEDRRVIEGALRRQAEDGPSERTARIINDAALRMRTIVSSQIGDLGFETYSANRRFLNSLAVEGQHALEEMQ